MSYASLSLLFSFLVASYAYWQHRSRYRNVPPGPHGLPLIGNLLDMPTTEEWIQYKQWSREYSECPTEYEVPEADYIEESDIIHLNVCGTRIIVLNSLKMVVDLLDKRSSIYSSRMGFGWSFITMPNNDLWKSHRRQFREEFEGSAIYKYYSAITRSTHDMLCRMVEAPERWDEHIRYMVGASIIDITYGIRAKPTNDPFIALAEKTLGIINSAVKPGAFLVDALPILKYVPEWVPGASFQTKAREWGMVGVQMLEASFDVMKKSIADGVARPSYCQSRLENGDDEDLVKNSAGTVYVVLKTFVLAMTLHPDMQARAQLEIDTLIGKNALPTISDQQSTPYLTALIKECLRWGLLAPFAVPHMLVKDDVYKGHFLPAGSLIMPNSWAIANDEAAYPDPEVFDPERYLKDGQLDPSVLAPEAFAFGYGRRICPGRTLAASSAWLVTASLLAAFTIEKAVDAKGAIIEPSGKISPGMIRHPEPFQCKIVPRNKEMREIVLGTRD
ncbi:hypothetical protein HWV62_4251 [Athelia sp. TMB]|nr:hypothetical protein HWV62_4251 [Athelia sp. TMB]